MEEINLLVYWGSHSWAGTQGPFQGWGPGQTAPIAHNWAGLSRENNLQKVFSC